MAVHGAAAPAHQYASRFLRAARPIVRPGAMERARAARGPVAPRAQRLFGMLRGLLGGSFQVFLKPGQPKSMEILKGLDGHISSVVLLFNIMIFELRGQMICASSE